MFCLFRSFDWKIWLRALDENRALLGLPLDLLSWLFTG